MNKLSFPQKNDLVVKHKDKKCFGKDLELFQKHFPSNRLMNDLAKANEWTFERLDGQMLYILLDKVSIEEILSNREETIVPVDETPINIDEKIEDLEARTDFNEDDIADIRSELENKDESIKELENKITELEEKKITKKKVRKKNSPP